MAMILDATASVRSMWYQKNNPHTVFFDKRCGSYLEKVHKIYQPVYPDVRGDWRFLPFKDNVFDMVVFDPPHLFRSDESKKLPSMCARYGVFYHDSWRGIMENGIKELFRVLKPQGFLIFKWCECDKSVDEVIKLFPCLPMFGTRTGQKNTNHWISFIKEYKNTALSDYADTPILS